MFEIAIVAILLAFAFTFTNGFQDASSVAATFIASRSASPRQGILMIAGMDFLGAMFGGSAVAYTLSGLISLEPDRMLIFVVAVAVIAATIWNLVTWKYGLPSSSTHALIGGLIGAGIASAGIGSIYWGLEELLQPPHQLVGLLKILVFLALSICIGLAGGFLMRKTTRFLLRNAARKVNNQIIRLNWVAASVMAFFNGANDSQKQLGIIALVLLAAGESATLDIPLWARFGCAILLGLGTLGGGWRIMKTLGGRIFKIDPIHSFDSQVSSGVSVAISTISGAPVSSTQVISTSVIGVGAAENPLKVQWSVGKDILIAMLMTIPITMIIAGFLYYIVSPFAGV